MSHHLLRSVASVVSVMAAGLASSATATAVDFPLVRTQEATIARIHAAMEAGELSCRELVQMYLDRIEVYDRRGPALRAIVRVNPNAMARAEALDAVFSRGERAGPLHCIPMIVKDNYDTADMPTTAGSRSLETSVPPDDAYQVLKIREAGAIVLAKSNMAEFAFSAYETLSSMVPGHTLNPYALDRVPAGSSGGTAAAVAASFGAVGLGTDTGNSIRGPSSHASLVGIRSTMGLTSRDGIVPLNLSRDIGGPIARTVRDAVLVFDVLAGHDPADESTAPARDRAEADYARYLVRDGLQGARVGVLRQLIQDTADPDVISLFDQALADMREQGAVIVDPVDIPGFDPEPPRISGCNYFKFDLNAYLAGLGPGAPVTSLDGIIESRKFHPSIEKRLLDAQAIELAPPDNPACREVDRRAAQLRESVRQAFAASGVDTLVYPTWSNPPRLLGDLVTPHGNNSPRLSPPTGFPAVTVPMGFTRGRFPAGVQLLGLPWSEGALIKVAYAYEQATQHRRPPASTPPLR